MKAAIRLFLLICVLLCFCHCGHKPYPQSLMTADSLASACPDSAVSLLKSIAGTMQDEPEATRMYYRLLCIKANDKAYILHTSDSLILPMLHYYIEKNDKRHLPEAYYYAGRVYRDLGDAPQALEYFEKALELDPDEKNTVATLKELYFKLRDKDPKYNQLYEEMQAKFDQLGGE